MRLAGGLLALAVVAALVGCGSDSGSSGGTDGSRAVVAPHGAPYSYEVPDGFEEAKASFPDESARYLSTVVPADEPAHSGTLSAFQWTLDATQRAYPTARLLGWLDAQTLAFYRGAGATLGAGARTEVAGRPAVCWRIHRFRNQFDGIVEADACAIVGSENVVQQACTWKPDTREVIERGCRELRASLKIS